MGPFLLLDGVPLDALGEGDERGVVDPDLMTFEDLRSAALLTAGPGAVTLPVAQLVGGNLTTIPRMRGCDGYYVIPMGGYSTKKYGAMGCQKYKKNKKNRQHFSKKFP